MAKLTGLTYKTPMKMQLDVGVFVTNYTKGSAINPENIIGATRGGGTIAIVPTTHNVDIDGAPTNTALLTRIVDWTATFTATMVEFGEDNIEFALGNSVSRTRQSNGDVKFVPSENIALSNYKTLYWIGALSSGLNIVVKFSNAMNVGGMTITQNNRGEGTYGVNIVAHYSPQSLSTVPIEITVEHTAFTISSISSKVVTIGEALSAEEAALINYTPVVLATSAGAEENGVAVSATAGTAGSATITLADTPVATVTGGKLYI